MEQFKLTSCKCISLYCRFTDHRSNRLCHLCRGQSAVRWTDIPASIESFVQRIFRIEHGISRTGSSNHGIHPAVEIHAY
jgi:hypothetical protein